MAHTWQSLIDGHGELTAYCENSGCRHSAKLDLVALRDRFGPDAPAMRGDILPKLWCLKCGGRNVDLKFSPDSSKVAGMMNPKFNEYQKAKQGR